MNIPSQISARLEVLKHEHQVLRLNLGCGARFHADWLNLDIVAASPDVIAADLRAGVPLPDDSYDVVYHCAILEHMRPDEARFFMGECFRVLKTGGILRVGVPDLEEITRLYLQKLEAARAGDADAAHERDWMCLELFDQLARERSGGQMLEYLRQPELPNENFILQRIGQEGRELLDEIRGSHRAPKSSLARRIVGGVKRRITRVNSGSAQAIGEFRLGGEAHQWMYDDFSLAQLLREYGFEILGRRDAFRSDIEEFSRFELDARADGTVNKPDCFFMEARKPAGVAQLNRG